MPETFNVHIKSQISIFSLIYRYNIIRIIKYLHSQVDACCPCNALAIWSIRKVDSTKRFRALITSPDY